MGKNLWIVPPKYGGAKHNKQTIKYYSQMAYGLSVFAVKYPDVACKLERIGDALSLIAETASRKANIQVFTNCIFDDFI